MSNANNAYAIPETPIYNIGRYARVMIDGNIHYSFVRTEPEHHVLRQVVNPDLCERFPHAEFKKMVDDGRIEVDEFFFMEEKPVAQDAFGTMKLCDFSLKKSERAQFYDDLFRAFLKRQQADRRITLSDASLESILPELKEEILSLWEKKGARPGPGAGTIKLPSPRHFRRLFNEYASSGYKAVSLVSRCRGGNRVSKVAPHDAELRQRFALKYASSTRPSVATLHRALVGHIEETRNQRAAEGLPPYSVPGIRTFGKQVERLDKFWVTAKREGMKAANEKFRIIGRGVDVERPLQRGEMDDWKVHLHTLLAQARVWERLSPEEQETVLRTRLWMTLVVDTATRCILAMRFSNESPSAATSLEAMETTLVDKTDIARAAGAASAWEMAGPFETLVTDAGSAYTAVEFRMALSDLGTEHMIPPSGEASLRPFVESVFKSFGSQFLDWFSGRTFSDFIEKGAYDSQAAATVCADKLNQLFVPAVVDIYHNKPHSGLGGETPRNAWERLSKYYGLPMPPSPRQRRHIFGIRLQRAIRDKGVALFNFHYQSEELQRLRQQIGSAKVECRLDRFDISEISVKGKSGWFSVPNLFGLPKGVSIWECVAAAEILAATHAADAEITLPAMMTTINQLRESGDALGARAEFATPVVTDRHVAAVEAQKFRNIRFAETDPTEAVPPLSPLAAAVDPLSSGVDLLADTALGLTELQAASVPDATATDSVDSEYDEDVEFDD